MAATPTTAIAPKVYAVFDPILNGLGPAVVIGSTGIVELNVEVTDTVSVDVSIWVA